MPTFTRNPDQSQNNALATHNRPSVCASRQLVKRKGHCAVDVASGRPGRLWTLFAWLFFLGTSLLSAQPVTLAWDPNGEADLGGYRVRYGQTSGSYTQSVDVGNVTTATLLDLQPGVTYYIVVTAYNTAGLESLPSNEVSFTTPSNQPPVVTLINAGDTFNAPATISISANASDPDGSVSRVEFWVGSERIAEKTSPPYTAAWNSSEAGDQVVTVRAFDNNGMQAEATATLQVVKLAASITHDRKTNEFGLSITGAPGRTAHVWVSNDLQNWTLLQDVANPSGTININDPDAPNHPMRFYKLSSD
jgi:hypothetical protein